MHGHRADKYPYPHDCCADKDTVVPIRILIHITDDLCSLIKLCFAFLWLIFRLNMCFFFVIHVENYLL